MCQHRPTEYVSIHLQNRKLKHKLLKKKNKKKTKNKNKNKHPAKKLTNIETLFWKRNLTLRKFCKKEKKNAGYLSSIITEYLTILFLVGFFLDGR